MLTKSKMLAMTLVSSLCLAQPSNTQLTYFEVLEVSMQSRIVDVLPVVRSSRVRATAYNAVESQTDATPDTCAWGDKIHPGVVAISRDLEKAGLTRGTSITVDDGNKVRKLVVKDRMHRRKRNQIDIYMKTSKAAKAFGRQFVTIYWNAGVVNIVEKTQTTTYRVEGTIFTDKCTTYHKEVLVEDPELLKFYEAEA